MNKPIVGQLAELAWKKEGENTDWQYAVVEYIFDDRYQLRLEGGTKYMHLLEAKDDELIDDQPTKSKLTLLFKNSKPAMAKKKLFGGYIAEPK